MNAVLMLASAGALFCVGVLAYRAGFNRTSQARPTIYALTFPTGLDAESVARFLAGTTGILRPFWLRWLAQPAVTFEIVASERGIRHQLVVPERVRQTIEAALVAHLPSVRYEVVEPTRVDLLIAAEYRLSTHDRALRLDPEGISSGVLAALQPLGRSESVVIQWVLAPAGPVRPAHLARRPRVGWRSGERSTPDAEAVSAQRSKFRAPLMFGVVRIGVHADHVKRARVLLRRAEGPWHAARAPGVHLRRRLIVGRLVPRRIAARSVPVTRWPLLINTEEVAGLIGMPIGSHQVPGLPLGGCRLLPVPIAVPTTGTVIGTSSFPGSGGRAVAIDLDARVRNVHCIGPVGVGKSTLLCRIALSDISAGRCVIVLDPKSDLITSIVERIEDKDLDRVIVLDASDERQPVGYNPLASTPGNRELVIENVHGCMKAIWSAAWGARTDEIARATVAALAGVPGMTLAETVPLLVDEQFRHRILSKVHDPYGVEAFFSNFENWSQAEKVANTAPVLNKLRSFTNRARLRGVLGQSEGAVDFSRIIRERQVLLVNLAAGKLGGPAAYLLGALIFAGLWDAVSARANQAAAHRPVVCAVLDEFQNLVALPTPAEEVLAMARGYGLGLVLAHQHLGQLDIDLQRAVLANCRTTVAYQTSRRDGGILAKELGGGLTPEDLMGIPPFEAVAACFAKGATQPPATVTLPPLDPPLRDAEEVFELSRQRFGMDRDEVDAAIDARQQGQSTEGSSRPIGRARRQAS